MPVAPQDFAGNTQFRIHYCFKLGAPHSNAGNSPITSHLNPPKLRNFHKKLKSAYKYELTRPTSSLYLSLIKRCSSSVG